MTTTEPTTTAPETEVEPIDQDKLTRAQKALLALSNEGLLIFRIANPLGFPPGREDTSGEESTVVHS